MAVTAPPPMSASPVGRLVADARSQLAAKAPLPPGLTNFDLARTRRMARDPLPVLLDCYERFGPIFAIRILHVPAIFMLGPAANRFILLEHPECFHWREGSFGDLIPLLGDGLLTIDGAVHRRARRIMLPAFHRERILAAGETMIGEIEAAVARWRPGERFDVYHIARALAMRVAMRALFGFEPGASSRNAEAADAFERALGFYGTDYHLRLLRGPGSPWRTLMRARGELDRLVFGEIARRRAHPDPDAADLLSLLLGARDEDGSALSDGEVRDQAMTLLFAGHDTTTSTITFLLYELARHPEALARIVAEQDRVLGGRRPAPADLMGDALPELEMAIDETLRLYPPAWVGPRRAVREFEFAGHTVSPGRYVDYSSWASHRLPDVFENPDAFVPRRFAPERRAQLPKGAYVPFGGGSRTCLGMRFGQLEVRAIATLALQRHGLELVPGRTMTVRQMPTLSPRGGLEMVVRDRGHALAVAA